jgi:SAM-dependent methyltransferase
MTVSRMAHRALLSLVVLGLTFPAASAQDKGAPAFEPQVGQSGKDVVWVPTSQAHVDKMLDLAKVTPWDSVMDLGSGDGRTVITAAKRGVVKAVGIEYNPDMVELSKRNAVQAGVGDKAQFMKADLFETDLTQATVITMFLLPDINLKLRPKILDLKPGTRIVSNSFTMGEWEADQSVRTSDAEGCTTYCTALLWIVPAKVEGTWQTPEGEIAFKQAFQVIRGTLKPKAGGAAVMVDGRLNGDQISFKVGKTDYTGRVNGNIMEGTTKDGAKWTATRVGKG